MATITTRAGKGSPLTNTELDANFTNLNSDKQEVLTEGAFVDGDKTKLDGIESGADVTDTANVTAAGALMDSEVTNLAQVKAFDSSDYATAAQGALADSALQSIPDNYILNTGDAITGDLSFGDNDKAIFGAGSDLQIYHDGSNTYILENGLGNLNIQATGSTYIKSSDGTLTSAQFIPESEARLFYNNVQKFRTTSTGIDVTGRVAANSLNLTSSLPYISFNDSDGSGLESQIRGDSRALKYYADFQGYGGGYHTFYLGGSSQKALNIASNGDISFYEDTGTTPKFFWDASAERLGIGTSSPEQQLHVEGVSITVNNANDDSSIAFQNSTSNAAWRIGRDYSNSEALSFAYTSNDYPSLTSHSKVVIDTSGNVGIGTSSPTNTLHVDGTLKVEGSIGTISTDSQGLTLDLNRAGTTGITNNNASGILTFGTATSERMRIDSSGNLLVGKTSANTDTVGIEARGSIGLFSSTRSGSYAAAFARNTSDGDIAIFRKDGTTVGSIGTASSYLTIGSGVTGLLFDDVSSKSIRPWNLDSNTASDADTDLGVSSQRFKDLYLSGGVYLGGTGSANKLDDYEEGTFTPTVTLGITSPTYSTQSGAYTKVGNLVSFALRVNLTAGTANASRVEIGGLPFTSSTTVSGSNGAAMLAYSNDVFDTTEATTFYISGNSTEVGFYNRDGNSFLGNQVNTPASFNVNIVGFYYTSS